MSVNDKMKAIADAIRAHTGGTDALTLDAMAEAIAGLEVGGGATIVQGNFTPAESTFTYEVQHTLGVKPKVVFYGLSTIDRYGISSASNPTYRAALYFEGWEENIVLMVKNTGSIYVDRYTTNSSFVSVAEDTVVLGHPAPNSSYYIFAAGKEYIWFAVG